MTPAAETVAPYEPGGPASAQPHGYQAVHAMMGFARGGFTYNDVMSAQVALLQALRSET